MTKWLLILGGVLGVIAALLVNVYIQQIEARQQSAVFIRVKDDVTVPSGSVLEGAMLESVAVPEEFGELASIAVADTPVNREWVLGRRVVQTVQGGQFLLHEHLLDRPERRFATQIGANKRAISIPVDGTTAVGFFVGPGSYVDLVGTVRTRAAPAAANGAAPAVLEERLVTRPIVQNVRVLAVGFADTWSQYQEIREQGYSNVTLELTLAQVEQLIFARTQLAGPLTLVLRNPADDGMVDTPSVNWDSLQ